MRSILLFITLTVTAAAQGRPAPAVAFTSSNLPIVVINTNGQTIVNEPKITADMGIIDNGAGVRNNLADPFNVYNGKIGIEIRGSSSQSFPKKQYAVETRDAAGEDLDVSLFGMPKEADWILSAQYNDKTLMRDVLVYTLTASMGRYASRTRYCELVINGDYKGVYMLFEKIKRDKGRVNISKMETTDVSGDALTGGYIIKIDKLDGSGTDGWYSTYAPYPGSSKRVYYQYHVPKPEDIVAAQKTYIKNFVLSYESMLNTTMFADSVNGYPKYFDVPSMVDVYLMNELTRNVDGFRLSAYLHKDRDSVDPRMRFGPVWDFNHSLGNSDYYEGAKTTGWQLEYFRTNAVFQNDDFAVPFWWFKVAGDPAFRTKAAERWIQLRKDRLSLGRIFTIVDSIAAHIDEAKQRNFERWPILGTYVWPNAYVGATYADEISYLKTWLTWRVNWMDVQLAGQSLGVGDRASSAPSGYSLEQNFPNPFNPATSVRFTLPSDGHVRLALMDMLGRTVRTVAEGAYGAGTHTVRLDAAGLASGVYLYRLQSGSTTLTRKMTVTK